MPESSWTATGDVDPDCETCDGDGYVEIGDDWGGVSATIPCPVCFGEPVDDEWMVDA